MVFAGLHRSHNCHQRMFVQLQLREMEIIFEFYEDHFEFLIFDRFKAVGHKITEIKFCFNPNRVHMATFIFG